jgi:RNA polymerase sigma-70 factor
MVLAMLRSMVYDKNAVDDLYQETMITAWRTLDRYDEQRPFGPWLRGIARFQTLAYYRKVKRLPTFDTTLVVDHIETRLDEITSRPGDTWEEKIDALDDCLQHLPEDARNIVALHYEQDLATGVIASRLRMSREAIKKRLQRARARLTDCFERKGLFLQLEIDS